MRLAGSLLTCLAVVGCEGEDPITCADPLQWTTGSMSLDATVDEMAPDAPVTFVGEVTLLFDCSKHSDTFVFHSASVVDYDYETELYPLTGDFAQGPISIPGDCTGSGTTTKTVAVELTGPTNEQLFTYCGTQLWAELTMTREGCSPDTEAVQVFGAQMFVSCPQP